ncbi:MAG: SMP-30/gluconolactonase/LRE family protein [Candidatus Obscuribacterales bacterium]|nr:SMP-30/gluconolactonase/LRE family protein [Candidatus Obscuribacterales bacterium]
MSLIAQPILQARAKLGEGSIWDSHKNVLYWVDILGCCFHIFDPVTGINKTIDVGAHVGTIVKRSQRSGGGFIVGLPGRIAHVGDDGKVETLCELEKGLNNRMNDGKCDPTGHFWCGSMNYDEKKGAGNLWMLDLNRQLHLKLSDVTISNGITWSADATKMYYIDTPTGHLDVFDFAIESGDITNRRVCVQNTFGGHFDGMTMDSKGNLYVAAWGGGCVYIFDPNKGSLLDRISVPGVKNVTSCAFGGEELNQLFITSSADKTKIEDEPNAGALFCVEIPGVHGTKAFEYAG